MESKITLILGSMKSGKSTKLLSILNKALKYQKKKVCLVRAKTDTRSFCTRDNLTTEAQTFEVEMIEEVLEKLKEFDVIGIDEAQFIEDLKKVLLIRGKQIFISGLNGDRGLESWKPISEVLPIVDDIVRLKAVCEDCKEFKYTFSYFEGSSDNKSQVLIGDNSYKALCRDCFLDRG